MKRQNYYREITTVNEIKIYDLYTVDWNLFEFTEDFIEHTLTENEIDKFYLVTQKYYNDLFNEDIIYFINKISDPTELKPGMKIKIPSSGDIRTFLKRYREIF